MLKMNFLSSKTKFKIVQNIIKCDKQSEKLQQQKANAN